MCPNDYTPTPWIVPDGDGNETLICEVAVDGSAGRIILDAQYKGLSARHTWATASSNAAFIVKAVNSYEAMLEALQNAGGLLDTPAGRRLYQGSDFYAGVVESIRAALSLAKSETPQ